MEVQPAASAAYGAYGHGLKFLNEEWNDSISNGVPFTLQWNQSLAESGSELGLFKVTYPKDGVVVYDLVSNLTASLNSTSCVWTPDGLDKELYTVWLSTGQLAHSNWTISPPWTPKEKPRNRLHWAAPIVIPVVCLLVLYAFCLWIYMAHRRRKREKREKEDATPHRDASRNNSVDSAITVQTFTESEDGVKSKPSIWLITHPNNETTFNTEGIWKHDDMANDPERRPDRSVVQSPV